MERIVVPEILDVLREDDPEARRSRRDLERINRLMGNFRWLRRMVKRFPDRRIVEMGAGDGGLLKSMAGEGKDGKDDSARGSLLGVDLQGRPEGLPDGVSWVAGDLFEVWGQILENPGDAGAKGLQPAASRAVMAIANLFLHHFEDDKLRELGGMLRNCDVLCFSEPLRSRLALLEGYALYPLVNRVTRHDMTVSIRGGFRRGELPALLGLDEAEWEIREQQTLLGACRLLAWRKR